jgi:hypothetical protein
MSEKISIQDSDGKRISAQYIVKDGIVNVTASDGRTTSGVIEDTMLTWRPSRRRFCLGCTGTGCRPIISETRRAA